MRGADHDGAGIHLQIVDAVRQGHTKRLRAEIVGEHIRRLPAPALSGVEEQAHQLAFLAVDADDGLAAVLEAGLEGAQMAKLLIALRMMRLSGSTHSEPLPRDPRWLYGMGGINHIDRVVGRRNLRKIGGE